ncbi:MAG: DcaP family trimeric outer membrane transporter [Magnetospirillum sp.]|nr:DcaP family trimeric outer membrane transporter [Magnetospirillum sp.]
MTLASGVRADEVEQLKAQLREMSAKLEALETQQKKLAEKQNTASTSAAPVPPPSSGSFPGSFLIPGTNTSMKIGGYVKLDIIDDLKGTNQNGSTVDFSTIQIDGTPQAKRQNQVALTARQSRLNIETRTPTEYGDLKTFIEGDFLGAGSNETYSNSATLRMRHLYGELGGVLAGQSWSNFLDVPSMPETIEFNGPVGQEQAVRQAQLRYTHSFGKEDTVAVAIENPEGDFSGADHGGLGTNGNAPSSRVSDLIPDLTARYLHTAPWGRVSLAGLVRRLAVDTGGSPQTFQGPNGAFTFNGSAATWGYGAALVGQFPTFGKDTLSVRVLGGPGIGRYISNANSTSGSVTGVAPAGLTNSNPGDGAVLSQDGTLHAITQYGGSVAYRHFWTDTLRSTVAVGAVHHENPMSYVPVNTLENEYSFHANLIWSPIPRADVGIEYIHGEAELSGQTAANKALGYGNQGSMDRVQVGVLYRF